MALCKLSVPAKTILVLFYQLEDGSIVYRKFLDDLWTVGKRALSVTGFCDCADVVLQLHLLWTPKVTTRLC